MKRNRQKTTQKKEKKSKRKLKIFKILSVNYVIDLTFENNFFGSLVKPLIK